MSNRNKDQDRWKFLLRKIALPNSDEVRYMWQTAITATNKTRNS